MQSVTIQPAAAIWLTFVLFVLFVLSNHHAICFSIQVLASLQLLTGAQTARSTLIII
jgi:hypothetical protein